jgi:hypothetical protein
MPVCGFGQRTISPEVGLLPLRYFAPFIFRQLRTMEPARGKEGLTLPGWKALPGLAEVWGERLHQSHRNTHYDRRCARHPRIRFDRGFTLSFEITVGPPRLVIHQGPVY